MCEVMRRCVRTWGRHGSYLGACVHAQGPPGAQEPRPPLLSLWISALPTYVCVYTTVHHGQVRMDSCTHMYVCIARSGCC